MWHIADKVRLNPGCWMRAWYSAVAAQLLSSRIINESLAHHGALKQFRKTSLLDPCDKLWTKTKHNRASAGINARGYPFTAISVLSAFPTKTLCSNRRGARGHVHWCLQFRNVQTLELIIRTAEIFPKNMKKKIANQCWIPHSGKLTDVVMLEKIKLILLMVTRQPHWHKRSIFSQILFWLLLLQTPFAHMTERSSWSPENSLEPHEPPKRLLVQACQFT